MNTPMRRMRAAYCARAVTGQATAAPPSNVMNSRRLMGFHQGQRSRPV